VEKREKIPWWPGQSLMRSHIIRAHHGGINIIIKVEVKQLRRFTTAD